MLGVVGAFGEVLADESVGVLVAAMFPGGCGWVKYTGFLVVIVDVVWRAISVSWSRVRVLFISLGKPETCPINTSHILVESFPFGSVRRVTNWVLRSTRVIAVIVSWAPMIRSSFNGPVLADRGPWPGGH